MTLQLDTTNLDSITFQLIDGKTRNIIATSTTKVNHYDSDKILTFLDRFLKKHKLANITAVQIIATKGGSYTGIRVGTALGQALSFAWNVPLKIKK